MKGLVVKNTGSWYLVRNEQGEMVSCKIKGNLRLKGYRCTNPVAVGDQVVYELKTDGTAMIKTIEPRQNYIIRRASNLSKEFQILASNLSQTVLVVTLVNPETNTTFIDRFLATAEAYRVPAIIAINKIDLLTAEDDRALLEAVAYLYRSIGYTVHLVSAMTGEGMDGLRSELAGKVTLFRATRGWGSRQSSMRSCPMPGSRWAMCRPRTTRACTPLPSARCSTCLVAEPSSTRRE